MIRWRYQIPSLAWVLISVILVEFALVNERFTFMGYVVFSLITATTLEVIRNRILQVVPVFNRLRFVLFLLLNGLIGIPLGLIVIILIMPMGSPWMFGDEDLHYASWQQYVLLSYGFIWFVINAMLLKLSNWVSVALLAASAFVAGTASLLLGLMTA